MRLHTHVALLHNSVLLGTEVFFLLLMAGGIYMRNSGLRAFKIMFREVRDSLFLSGSSGHASKCQAFILTGLAVAYFCRAGAERSSRKRTIIRQSLAARC